MARCVRRSGDGFGQCANEALKDSILCSDCGGNLPEQRRAAAEQTALAKLIVQNNMTLCIEEAMAVLLSIMRNGDKDSDRLKAVDRVLELAGVRTDKPLVAVQVNTGLNPQADSRDARLLDIIQRVDTQRAELLRQRAIETLATDVAS